MNREEAIEYLKHADTTVGKKIKTRTAEALDMAIKALQQQPCEDAISRQAVLDAIMANCIWENEYNLTSSRIKKAVESLPSVTPKQKMGRWKRISMDKYSEHAKYWYRCDRCGKDNLGNTDYCPNCGQPKMQEVEEA